MLKLGSCSYCFHSLFSFLVLIMNEGDGRGERRGKRRKTTCRRWFSPSTMWILAIEPISIGLAGSSQPPCPCFSKHVYFTMTDIAFQWKPLYSRERQIKTLLVSFVCSGEMMLGSFHRFEDASIPFWTLCAEVLSYLENICRQKIFYSCQQPSGN